MEGLRGSPIRPLPTLRIPSAPAAMPSLISVTEAATEPQARPHPPRSGHCAATLPAWHPHDVIIFGAPPGGCCSSAACAQLAPFLELQANDHHAARRLQAATWRARTSSAGPATTPGPSASPSASGRRCSTRAGRCRRCAERQALAAALAAALPGPGSRRLTRRAGGAGSADRSGGGGGRPPVAHRRLGPAGGRHWWAARRSQQQPSR